MAGAQEDSGENEAPAGRVLWTGHRESQERVSSSEVMWV